jgi:hypothetical protein
MAAPVFKHQEDDGDLSIFASGDTIVLACEHGHYWVLQAKQQSGETVKPVLEEALSADSAKALLKAM